PDKPIGVPKKPFFQYVITASTLSRLAAAEGKPDLANRWLKEAQDYLHRVPRSTSAVPEAQVLLAEAATKQLDGDVPASVNLVDQALKTDPSSASHSIVLRWGFEGYPSSEHQRSSGSIASSSDGAALDCQKGLFPP